MSWGLGLTFLSGKCLFKNDLLKSIKRISITISDGFREN